MEQKLDVRMEKNSNWMRNISLKFVTSIAMTVINSAKSNRNKSIINSLDEIH